MDDYQKYLEDKLAHSSSMVYAFEKTILLLGVCFGVALLSIIIFWIFK